MTSPPNAFPARAPVGVNTAPATRSRRGPFAPRVTVATVVERDGRFLFVEEVILDRRVLNQPAGHLDPNESLIEAAVRETLEETGWDVEPLGLIGIYQHDAPDRHFVRTTIAARPLRHHPQRKLDHGIVQALWLSREELLASALPQRSPMVLRCLEDYLARPLLPLSALIYQRPLLATTPAEHGG